MAVKNLGRIVGLSAYEVWLEQGNTGTEQDYLNSLKGEQGEKGADGKTPVKNVDYFTEEDKQEIINELAGQGGDLPVNIITGNTNKNPFIYANQKPGIYIFNNYKYIYTKSTEEDTYSKEVLTFNREITIFKNFTDAQENEVFGYYVEENLQNTFLIKNSTFATGYNSSSQSNLTQFLRKDTRETITSKHTYTTLPESSVVPTTDDQFTNKAYVDSAITTAINNITNGDEVSY